MGIQGLERGAVITGQYPTVLQSLQTLNPDRGAKRKTKVYSCSCTSGLLNDSSGSTAEHMWLHVDTEEPLNLLHMEPCVAHL